MLWRKFNGDVIELPIIEAVENAIRLEPVNDSSSAALELPVEQVMVMGVITSRLHFDPDGIAHETPMPNVGDELHHYGWNRCSSAITPSGTYCASALLTSGARTSRSARKGVVPPPWQKIQRISR